MMSARWFNGWMVPVIGCFLLSGCKSHTAHVPHEQCLGPPYDRPFPLGQVTDSHWETQQTNSEAADFIFYDHEFDGDTAHLTPAGRKHLMQVALRIEHVPFPIVVEESPNRRNPRLDAARHKTVVDELTHLGLAMVEPRVIVAPAFDRGLTAIEGEAAYYSTLFQSDFGYGGGVGRRFGGRGGAFR
ncbi:MAG: hypothetical protein ACYTG0_03130 [Planctomycetota bacterium]|jgi:hypothetical protein